MSCTVTTRNIVAQECMALTKNPFQFRISPLRRESGNEGQLNDEVDKVVDDDSSENVSSENVVEEQEAVDEEKSTNESSINEAKKVNATNEPTTSANQTAQSNDQSTNSEEVNDFKKGLKIDVLCKEDYYLCYFWGLNIDQFHNFMRLNSQSFKERLFDGTLFDQAFLEKSEPEL